MLIASVVLSREKAKYTLVICLTFAIHYCAGMLAKQRVNCFFFKDLILVPLSDHCFHTGPSLSSCIVQKGKVHIHLVLLVAKTYPLLCLPHAWKGTTTRQLSLLLIDERNTQTVVSNCGRGISALYDITKGLCA